MNVGVDLATLEAARIEAIRRIWAIIDSDPSTPVCLRRHMTVSDEGGVVLLVLTFEEAVGSACLGCC